jgi:hypothetical protein
VYERSIERCRPGETISAGDALVLDEVASAYRLKRVLHSADPWRSIQCCIERAPKEALVPNCDADGGNGDDRAELRHGA